MKSILNLMPEHSKHALGTNQWTDWIQMAKMVLQQNLKDIKPASKRIIKLLITGLDLKKNIK